MTEYYFDIETLGTDPQDDKIITIQYQKLEDGQPVEDMVILKEWESSEGDIVKLRTPNGVEEIEVLEITYQED